jgi:pyruvate formate lyase activating enzyme
LAAFLVSISPDIPWHVSRFYPSYRLLDTPSTPVATIENALRIGREEGLHYVYGGNIPGHSSESTVCPGCGEVVIERQGYRLGKSGIHNGMCTYCGSKIAIH